jgi:PTS system nitrogen regulatory IIA component
MEVQQDKVEQKVSVADLLSPSRVDLDCRFTSKKRLMEHVASMLARGTDMDEQAVFRILIEREKLGSTGVGHGVALPHGRLEDIDNAILALAILADPLDYQAADNRHVRIVVGLVVPENANEAHLQILARLAKLLSEARVRERLLQASDKEEIFSALREVEAG